MGDARFYHLVRRPAESLLPTLIGKSREAGWRVELRGTGRERMERLDELLWQDDGFLPHGLAGGPHDAEQPVLLTVAGSGQEGGNRPGCLIALDGAAIADSEIGGLSRICVLFADADTQAVQLAREQWRSLTGAGLAAEYWTDKDGAWERKR